MLSAGPRNTHRVHFLKSVITDERNGHLPSDHNYGHRVHIRRGNAGHRIGGTRATGDQRHTNLASDPGISICCMHCRLLMAHENMPDGILLCELVINIQHRTARITENMFHTFITQRTDHNLRTRQVFFYQIGTWAILRSRRGRHRRTPQGIKVSAQKARHFLP